jgi:hypothetical protein
VRATNPLLSDSHLNGEPYVAFNEFFIASFAFPLLVSAIQSEMFSFEVTANANCLPLGDQETLEIFGLAGSLVTFTSLPPMTGLMDRPM